MATKSTSAGGDGKQTKIFTCSLCNLSVDYHYYGKKPPFVKSLMLLEDCYVMKDPFSSTGGLITLGGTCSQCGSVVCMSPDCSLFYSKRFCLPCVLKQQDQFPAEIQQEVSRKQVQDNR
ncbi:cysteine-rich DPF motif domain-containing protein 1-like [Littorina saxatilis]|uniref:Cysteine-rich DPF motif domain-containing protein 1 n=1 Tax=Littorina saxatilis TaxID=31220 RepID=A0AAN9GBR3_9CAEN